MMRKLGIKRTSSKQSFSHDSSNLEKAPKAHSNSIGPNAIPIFERQVLPSQTLLELRLACALIVKETGPTGAELEAILNQPDPLESYTKEVTKLRQKAASTQKSSFPAVKAARERDRTSKSNLASANQSTTTLPLSRPLSNVYVSTHKSTSALPQPKPKPEPIASVSIKHSNGGNIRNSTQARDTEALAKIRAQMEARPKTSAAACVDYHSQTRTADSSGSTTRSNTTFERHISTGVTSFAQTPADDKRGSYQFPRRSSSRQAVANPMIDRISHHEHNDYSSPNPDYALPTLYHPKGSSNATSRDASRTRSRASSIKDSIIGGIRDYIQPRPSLEALSRSLSRQQSRPESRSSSRPGSRGSNMSQTGRNWIRNAATGLRRKGSFSSWRSSRPEDEDRGRGRDKGPDLNRSLPPLPSLDQYKEPKMHIAQMLAHSSPSPQPQIQSIQSPSNISLPRSPFSPGKSSTSVATTGIINPQNSARQFPRIPFSDSYMTEAPHSRHAHPLHELSQKERQWQEVEFRRRRQEQQTVVRNPELDKRQEDEIRRVVREKIKHGGLAGETVQLQDSQQHFHDNSALVKQYADVKERERRERHRRVEAERSNTETSTSHKSKRSSHEKTPQSPEGQKKTLRTRFSRFMHGGSFAQGQSPVVTAN